MQELISGMKKDMLELTQWQNANQDIPKAVKTAIRIYRGEMVKAIESMEKPLFEVGDSAQLESSSFDGIGHFRGDTGKVVDITSTSDTIGQKEWDIRV